MHMSDALVTPVVAVAMDIAAAGAAGYSVKKIQADAADTKKIPLMGVMGAFVFAAQMINFAIPGTASSGHLCGGILLTAMLGPYAGYLTLLGILLIQCLLFADGGILALGCNIWNMAFYGCFVGGAFVMAPILRRRITKERIMAASVLGAVLSLQLGAFSVVLQTLLSGITELPFAVFAGMMQPIHLAIGIVEGLVSGAVLCFVYGARPEFLWFAEKENLRAGGIGRKQMLGILAAVALVLGGGISLLASGNPDGLEWSLQRSAGTVAGTGESAINKLLTGLQQKLSLLADYTMGGSENTWVLVAVGIAGTLLVMAAGVFVGKCLWKKGE